MITEQGYTVMKYKGELKMATRKKSENVKKIEKQIKEMKKPVYLEKLELGGGEIFVGNLSEAEKYQLLIRHINVLENNISLLTQFSSMQAICLQEICKKQGIEIDKIINNK